MNQESGRAPPSTWTKHIAYHWKLPLSSIQDSKDIQAANGSRASRQTNSRPTSVGNGEDKAPPKSSHCHPIGFAKVNSTTEVGPKYPHQFSSCYQEQYTKRGRAEEETPPCGPVHSARPFRCTASSEKGKGACRRE